jgi:hypothetical protein
VLPLDDKADGEACDDARDCASGTCVRGPGDDDAVCAGACDAAHACANDDVCLALAEGARACFAPVADGGPCSGADVCAGGRCIEDRDAGAVCASVCPAPQDADSCADGFLCVDDADGDRVCMPVRNEFAEGEACVDERDCASRLCGRYVAEGLDESLCARPCPAAPDTCGADQICWEGDDGDLCGPTPP